MSSIQHNRRQQQRRAQHWSKANNTNVSNYNRIWCTCAAILVCILATACSETNAVPTDSGGIMVARSHLLQRVSRDVTLQSASPQSPPQPTSSTTRDIIHNATVMSIENVSDQPKGQCLMDEVLVDENTVFCEKQEGCRAIQKTGHCCPDYRCDCEKDGVTYANGAKLVDPETPCTVCYCQGGEIICISVTCYYRSDCNPTYIPGRCCPEYDNCPVESKPATTNKTTILRAETEIAKQEKHTIAMLNPEFTIKEITKPSEIRITDDRRQIHQMPKPFTANEQPPSPTTTTSTTTTSTTTTTITPSSTTKLTKLEESNFESSTVNNVNINNESSGSSGTGKTLLPTTVGINNGSLKLIPSVAYTSTELFAAMPSSDVNDTMVTANAEDSAEIDFDDDKVEGTIFGATGLQVVESESANDPSKVNIKREYSVTTEDAVALNTSAGDYFSVSAEVEPDTAGSDNIYHIIMTTDGPRVNTESSNFKRHKESSTTEGPTNQNVSMLESIPQPQSASSSESPPLHETTLKMTEETLESSSIAYNKRTTVAHADEEDVAVPMESNPAYPSLPEDDFSLRDVPDEMGDAYEKDEPRSIVVSYDTLTDVDGSGSGMMSDMPISSTTPVEYDVSSTTEVTNLKLEKVELMYSAEDNSSETAISNNTNFQYEKLMKNAEENDDAGSGDSEEAEMVASGNNSSTELSASTKKPREPTTPRPTRRSEANLEIDELGASGDTNSEPIEDPKLDVESLKFDENQQDDGGVAKVDTAAVALPAKEKTIEQT